MVAEVEAEDVNRWLEWAGSRLLALGGGDGPKVQRKHGIEYLEEASTAFGYSNPRLRVPRPSKDEIPVMDEILLLPLVIDDVLIRRIVHARLLVTPIINRHLYSWTTLAKLIHTDRRTVARRHAQGIRQIAERAEPKKVCLIAAFMTIHLRSS